MLANGRILEDEGLDTAEPAAADRNLHDLARINRWFGGHRTLLRILADVAQPREAFSLLDVGAASGDMAACVRRRFRNASVTVLDRIPSHLKRAAGRRVAADAFHAPFRAASFDFVLCSSLLHHFPNHRVVELIAGLYPVARRALILMDIERHPLAHGFLPVTRKILGWSELTVQDGSMSVAAAFRAGEIESLVHAAVGRPISARRHWPWFRISAVLPATPQRHPPSAALRPVGAYRAPC